MVLTMVREGGRDLALAMKVSPPFFLVTASTSTAITTDRGDDHDHGRCSWSCLKKMSKRPQVARLLPQGPREGPRLVVFTTARGSPRGDSLCHIEDEKKELVRDVHRLARLGVQSVDSTKGGFMVHHSSELSLVVDVKSKQHLDPILMELKESILNKFVEVFSKGGDWVLSYQRSLCVLDVDGLREQILEEAHVSRYSIYPGATKLYRDLREVYWYLA
ncbi:hypothetical protein MTR67_038614 [Solanum verrucosum]|uniref:Uncharacterized protein n=1 Tax=Solanum verrucosum TaxID=315347 RepID=A0AAF0ZQE2_SOLVR|nr:hypothetical protein MTR67_038614 [Solanum verrucosum]